MKETLKCFSVKKFRSPSNVTKVKILKNIFMSKFYYQFMAIQIVCQNVKKKDKESILRQ